MPDGLDAILRLVAQGHISADEAAPVVEALLATEDGPTVTSQAAPSSTGSSAADMPAHVRVLVTERGRPVVNLRVPLALGKAAVALVPGLSLGDAARLDAALTAGRIGPLLDVTDDDGDGVRVVLE